MDLARHFRNTVTYFTSFRARTLAPALARLSVEVRARLPELLHGLFSGHGIHPKSFRAGDWAKMGRVVA